MLQWSARNSLCIARFRSMFVGCRIHNFFLTLLLIQKSMGTREVYEKKLKSGNLHFDPTMNPGLGTARCPRCYTIIDPNARSGSWTITPELHDIAKVAGFGIGGLLSAVFGVNIGIPFIQKHVTGPKWMQLIVKNRAAQETILFKDEKLREAQSWVARLQEIDALQSTALHAQLRDRTEQFNQYWIGLQR